MASTPPHQPRARLLRPTWRVATVHEIDLELLIERQIRGLIFDLDDTLVHALEPHANLEVVGWLARVRETFQAFIVSNNRNQHRVSIASDHLGLPFLANARKPSGRFFRKALEVMALAPHEVAIIGDQLFTDVLGGNRLGALTILVDPMSAERKLHRKMMRSLETYMLKRGGIAYHPPRAVQSPTPTHHPSMGPGGGHHE